jgi:Tol biopolymer transport system component
MLRGRTLAAVATCGFLSDTLPTSAAVTWLTAPQSDTRRSRGSDASVHLSGDGRYVAFTSYARLTDSDLDSMADVYVLDRATATLTLESLSADGRLLNSDIGNPSISADGRYVTFDTVVAGGSPRTHPDIVLRDRVADTARRITTGPGGVLSNGWSGHGVVVADGSAVLFASAATNLISKPDGNGSQTDIYRFDLRSHSTERISLDSQGLQHPGRSLTPKASSDGRYVVFSSTAALTGARTAAQQNPGPGDRPAVYLRDLQTGRTTLASPDLPNDASTMPAISADGQSIAFVSRATNLAARDRNKSADVFLYDVGTGTLTLISRRSDGESANGTSLSPSISGDGRWIAFQSDASDMACGRDCVPGTDDINLLPDVFLFNRATGQISCISRDRDRTWMEESIAPAIDATGAVVAFSSRHPVSARDVANDFDLFVRILAQ